MIDDPRSEAERARDALRYKGFEVRERLKPGSLFEDAKQAMRKRALTLGGAMLTSKKGRPVVAAGAVVAGAAYLLRKPLAKLLTDRLGKKG